MIETESELNEGIATILDADKTAIETQEGTLRLRDLLTAVYKAQAPYSSLWYKLFGKPKVSPENILLYLPEKVGEYIHLSEGGRYLGFYTQIKEALDLLSVIGVLDTNDIIELDEVGNRLNEEPLYGVSAYGKAFVNYGEVEEN